MRRFDQIGVLRLMATRAGLHLGRGCPHGILGGVHGVTAAAAYVACRMRARGPVMCGVRLMTAQALQVLPGRRGECLRSKIDHPLERPPTCLYMCAARSMARFALQTTTAEGAVWVIGSGVLGAENSGDAGITMTAEAGIRSVGAIDGIRVRRPIGRECRCGEAQQQSEHDTHADPWRTQLKSPRWGYCARPSHPQRRRHCDRCCRSPRSRDWCSVSCGLRRPS